MSELVPDGKGGAAPLTPGAQACGCCAGIEASTPRNTANRHGLPAIAYRAGDHAAFRDSLHAGLSAAAAGPLQALLTRDTGDFTIGLIDAFACAADVLTFYSERIANESWLATATERVSLQEMGKLIGYRLRPGVAAETWLAFTLETPPQPPAALKEEPGTFVSGVPAALTIGAGFRVASVPGPGELPQTFETVEAVDARPQWNAMRPWLDEVRRPGRGDRETWLAGTSTGLKPGDGIAILGDEALADASSDQWDFRLVDRVEADAARERTRITWGRALGSLVPFSNPSSQRPQLHALRRRGAPYGHNAPRWKSLSEQFRKDYGDTELELDQWPDFVISPAGATSTGGYLDLDAPYPEVVAGGYAVLARGEFNRPTEPAPAGTYIELYQVGAVAEVSRDDFAMSGKVTRLLLRGENYTAQFAEAVRQTTAFVQSQRLEFAPYPVTTAVSGDRVPLAVPAEGLLAGRRVIVRGRRADDGSPLAHAATVSAVTVVDAQRCELRITPALPAALARESVVVFGNVAPATHGETTTQVLGQGNAAQPFQRFELKRSPLTHRLAPGESGVASELTVRVDDVAWSRRASLYGAAPQERAWTLDSDEEGRTWVRFGDGVAGARLPSGTNNVHATWRVGLGAAGNVRADTLTQAATRPLGFKGVSNPLPALGGTDPEPPSQARASMPLGVRTLGRAVSLLDYEDFARAFAGIAKAQAALLQLPSGPVVAITIAGADGAVLGADHPVRQRLLAELQASGDPHVAVRLLAHQPVNFRIGLKLKCDPAHDQAAVRAAVEATLRARYAFEARALGQPVQQSDVIATVHTVPGVVAVDLDFLFRDSVPPTPSRQPRLLAARMRVSGHEPLPAEILTLHPDPLYSLGALP
ncbi:putative baseplate assembly protein [uncultured Azohydromonas sp.]|uniref:putative baseplate assembly protein n=1 Tax=uncultured Azohydromonas sp. TaxID=487342 RepID=UPI00262CECBA|nr:putative baseplate assembly protein [uncultured Azohydromonas sp.]